MKRFSLFVAAVSLSLLLAGCGSTSQVSKTSSVASEVPLDWQGREFGVGIPSWAQDLGTGNKNKLKKHPEAEGKKLFALHGEGQDRDLIFSDIGTRRAFGEIAREIETHVRTTGKSGISGNKDSSEGTSAKVTEELAIAFSRATFSGLEELETFWTLVRRADGKTEYRCYALYGMEEELYKKQVHDIVDKVKSQSRTPEELSLLERLDEEAQKLVDEVGYTNVGEVR